MTEEKVTTEEKDVKDAPKAEAPTEAKAKENTPKKGRRKVSFIGKDKPGGRSRKGGAGRGKRNPGDPDAKVLDIRRVTRVTSGGRRFSFSVTSVVGDRNGKVGVGVGKGSDTAVAMDKANRDGKKNMIKIVMTKEKSIPQPVEAKYCSAKVLIQPSKGRGLVAGSAVRTVLDLAGITDVNAKIMSRSKNKLNIARATIKALSNLK